MIELRRRYLGQADQNAPTTLERLLVLPVTPPPLHVGHGVATRDALVPCVVQFKGWLRPWPLHSAIYGMVEDSQTTT